jgi:hypothetical protein
MSREATVAQPRFDASVGARQPAQAVPGPPMVVLFPHEPEATALAYRTAATTSFAMSKSPMANGSAFLPPAKLTPVT